MTSIYKLKKLEYQEGSRLAFENFEDLIAISKKAESMGNFGIASSLCVLALEELSKSVILYLKSIDNSIPFKDLDKYFTSHDKKQKAAIAILWAIQLENEVDTVDFSPSDDSGFSIIIGIVLTSIFIAINFSYNKFMNESDKKSYFNKIKESGFYVSYDSVNRQWKSPKSEHNKKSYDDLFNLTNVFADKIKNWIFNGKIDIDNLISFLDEFDIIDKKQLAKLNNKKISE